MKLIITYRLMLLCIGFLTMSQQGFSQNTSMDWVAESFLLNVNGTDVEISSNITKQGTAIVWEQQNPGTTQSTTFNLISVTGSWNIQNGTGSIDYELDQEGISATMNVIGTSEGITITLTYYANNSSTDEMIFQIDNLDQL
ncbi:hypothetical protein [Winogradskyella flava]|uniref:Lipocalin-like domain-containing protein n=1 Tax=Winogradskyella flava TaxID=1884876 RepID=A0A842IPM5_9FLAO|nr:hypothetical protein [Winogradskyella flava]MBC2844625.1 hypothetical protein [Winogradskyella flava]